MDTYHFFKEELLQVGSDLAVLLDRAEAVPGMGGSAPAKWRQTCSDIREQVSEDLLRVAVVGPIKSGKSTFVNSLFGGDYLKRGAGVVTSIVTRIHRGEQLRATLWFKSWETINRDISEALVLFPSGLWNPENRASEKDFDIRRDADRAELAAALDALRGDRLITNDTRNMDSVLLSSYIAGYDRVKDIPADDESAVRHYEGDEFPRHKDFAGDDALAVYLEDIQLEITQGTLDETIEIADCQGSDSPNPLHLAMIQDYLRRTHLIVYVISSRTGLRQADIKFLSAIKKMGILDNALFLVNFDFGEHDSIEDLNRVTRRVGEELSLLRPDPDIYVLSALFNLFRDREKDLPIRDNLRLVQWKGESRLAAFSDQETARFRDSIHRKLTRERYALLLRNHLERFGVIASGVAHWIAVNNDILVKDAFQVGEIVAGVKLHQQKTGRIRDMIRSTLDGAVQKVKRSMRPEVDRFFDARDGITAEVIRFVRNCEVNYGDYEAEVVSAGFSGAMYRAFQDVRHSVDTFMAESVNPEVIRFIREQEQAIQENFATVSGPYDTMVRDALEEYNLTMKQLGIPPVNGQTQKFRLPDTATIRDQVRLKLPPASTALHYSVTIRTEAVMRLGFYRAVRFLRKLIKKPVEDKTEGEIRAIRDGVSRLRKETEKSILFHFKDYRENIKFQYIFKLVDAVADYLYNALLERFDAYGTDLSRIADQVGGKQVDREAASASLKELADVCREIQERIHRLRDRIINCDSE